LRTTLSAKHDDELVELERARAHAPSDPDVLSALGEGYMERRRYAEAEEMAVAALREEPEHAHALVLRGHLHLLRGSSGTARDHALWVLSSDATHRGALLLLTAVKARSSIWLGAWWRYHSFMTSIGEARSTLVLLGAFALYRVGLVALAQQGKSEAQGTLMLFWLAVCVYTWVGPGLFKRALDKELATVRLKDDF
jgi:tetratricopeptide (TPR) repeat protein